jgi:hypothetical protein
MKKSEKWAITVALIIILILLTFWWIEFVKYQPSIMMIYGKLV